MPATIRLVPWPDPVLDVLGHDPRSWYVETFWLPTLGPTALLLLRHVADRFDAFPDGLHVPVAETAAALGLGPRDGASTPIMRTLTRLQQFELVHRRTDDEIAVRRLLPPIHRRHVRRLPTAVQAKHAEWVANQLERGPVDLARRRARRIALTLLVEGDTGDGVERALHRGGFHPALAHEAVRWAKVAYAELDTDASTVGGAAIA